VRLGCGGGSHAEQTAKIMVAYEQLCQQARPAATVVVVGDVNSTLACAIVAKKLCIPVAHVEAGLRSGDMSAMPEEINRLVTDANRENLGLMAEARLVLTDSGGIQEESSYLGVPCLTLRRNTERPVTVTQGTNTLVGDDLDAARRGLNDIEAGRYKAGQTIEGWDGHAAVRVVAALNERWS
jgi:UDP-N-acetylglucosamine 2-epimerase